MFFKQKSVPLEWSHLTPREVHLCQKARKKSDSFDAYYVARKALEEGSLQAVAIILPWTNEWASHLYSNIFSAGPACREAILPALSKVSASAQVSFLSYTTLCEDAGYLARVLEQITDEQVRARAVCRLLGTDSLPSERTRQLCHAYIDAGLNVHYEGGLMLKLAVQKGEFNFADKIIDKGFDLATFGPAVYQALVGQGASPEAIGWFKGRAGKSIKMLLPQTVGQPDDDFHRVGSDSISRTDTLPNGARLTTVFNFSSGQQLVYVSEEDRLSAPAITSLFAMENRRLLDMAIAAFVAQEGDPAITAPFKGMATILKPAQTGGK